MSVEIEIQGLTRAVDTLTQTTANAKADLDEAVELALAAGGQKYVVDTVADLSTIPSPKEGESALVRADESIWQRVGSSWVDRGLSPLADKAPREYLESDADYLGGKRVIGGFRSSTSRYALAVMEDGQIYAHGISDFVGAWRSKLPEIAVDTAGLKSSIYAEGEQYLGGKRIVGGMRDSTGRYAVAILEDGSVSIHGLAKIAPDPDPEPVATPIVCYGDSLTENGLASALATASGRTATNAGIGGQVSQQIASRHGGLGTDVTISSDQIVSGSNTVTHLNGVQISGSPRDPSQLLSAGAANSTRNISVVICGITGTLTRTASGGPPSTSESYTFTPDAGQSLPVHCPPRSPLFVQNRAHMDRINVLWAGRNDGTAGWGDGTVLRNVSAMVRRLELLGNRKFVVLGVINGNYADEKKGGSRYENIIKVNRELAQAYPDNFFDARRFLIDRALAAAGITPTTQDLADIADDIVPSSLRTDNIHINSTAYIAISGSLWAFISEKEW